MACSFISFHIFDAELILAGILAFSLRQCYIVLSIDSMSTGYSRLLPFLYNLQPIWYHSRQCGGTADGGGVSISSTQDVII